MSLETIHALIKRRDEVDALIENYGMVLNANNAGMDEPLTDSAGFPRNDIDVHTVRNARRAIIDLQNDRKAITAEFEKEMALFYGQQEKAMPSTVQEQSSSEPMEVDEVMVQPSLTPFAVVQWVKPGLLADRKGIAVNDKILQIGTLSSQNFKSLDQVEEVFRNARGRKLQFVIRKANTNKDVTVEVDLGGLERRLGIQVQPL